MSLAAQLRLAQCVEAGPMSEAEAVRIQAAFDAVVLKEKTAQQAMEEIVPDIDEILAETAQTPLPEIS